MGQRLQKINWKSYNRELIGRGSITFWVDEDSLSHWFHDSTGSGFQKIYSDLAIEMVLLLRCRFHLPLRGVQGFAESVFQLMEVHLPVPNYSTLNRRAAKLETSLDRRAFDAANDPVHAVVDSTGLKVFGEGEWKVRQHGYTKRRTWRKLHLAVNEATGEIMASILTENSFKDNEVFEDILSDVKDEVFQVSADGAYDAKNCWDFSEKENIRPNFPPRKGARIQRHKNSKASPTPRDEHLRAIREFGKPAWRALSGYSRRSLAETAMFRFKITFDDKLSARNFDQQATEAFIKCKILNKMKTPAVL